MEESYNDVITVSVLSSLLDPIHNKFLIKSSVNSLPGNRKWWLQCYPAGNADNCKDALILMLRLKGGPVSVETRVAIKGTSFSRNKRFEVTRNSGHTIILYLMHSFLKGMVNSNNFDIEVHGTFNWKKESVQPQVKPSLSAKPVNGSVSSLPSAATSRSASIDSVAKLDLNPMPKKITQRPISPPLSCQIVLSKGDFKSTKIGSCFSSPKYDVPSIPGLQWWLDYYPNGIDKSQPPKLMVFMRVSTVPIDVSLKYSVMNAMKITLSGTKVLSLRNGAAYPDIVQMKHENSNFKDALIDGVMTIACFPSFTVPDEVVPSSPTIDTKPVNGLIGSLPSAATSRSTSIDSVVKPVSKKVSDSCTINLIESNFFPSNKGKLIETPKRGFANVPTLQWWLHCYPAGNSVKDPKERLLVFLRCSVAPVKITATYYVPGTTIRRELTDTIHSATSQGFSYAINHDKMLANDSFVTGPVKLCCDVTIHVPNNLIQKSKPSATIAKPLQTAASLSNASAIVPSSSSSISTSKTTAEKSQTAITDSTFIVLNKQVDLHPRNSEKPLVTAQRRIKEIPGLEWWLEVFPAGNSKKQNATLIAFVRVSKVPVDVDVVYTFPGTDIKRQIQSHFASTNGRGANLTVSHTVLTTSKVFNNGNGTLHCSVTFNKPQHQTTPVPLMFQNSALKSELSISVKSQPATTSQTNQNPPLVPDQLVPTPSSLKFYVRRMHFTNPSYLITTSKRKMADGIEWFITCSPGAKDDEGKGCINIYLNASTNVSGNVKYEVEGTHFRGTSAFKSSTSVLVKQIYHRDLNAFSAIQQFDVKIVATLAATSRATTPSSFSDSSQLPPSSIASSDDEEDSEWAGMADEEFLEFRLKQQIDETNLVMQLLQKMSIYQG